MPTTKCLNMLNSGVEVWNNWRNSDEGRDVDLSDIDFVSDCPKVKGFYNLPEFYHYNFSGLYINRTSLRNGMFIECDFSDSNLYASDLVDSYFQKCDFNYDGYELKRRFQHEIAQGAWYHPKICLAFNPSYPGML